MKILHIGLCVDYKNEGLPFALKEASTEYVEFQTGDRDLFTKLNRLDFKPDLIFTQIQTDRVTAGSTNDLVNILKRFNSFIVHWNGDCRANTPQWHFEAGFDLLLFSNMKDVEESRKRGFKGDFLQIGIDPKVFKKWKSDEKGNDIVYLGNNYRNQFPESHSRAIMIGFLQRQYKDKFSVFGNGWSNGNGENNADQIRQSKIYNNSKIGINYSQFNSDRYTSDRMFRILASGCFCLSHHYKGIEKDFEVGKHLDTFKNLQELRQKIDYYLTHEDERENIAQQGYEYCHDNFTYFNMVENLIKLYHDQN